MQGGGGVSAQRGSVRGARRSKCGSRSAALSAPRCSGGRAAASGAAAFAVLSHLAPGGDSGVDQWRGGELEQRRGGGTGVVNQLHAHTTEWEAAAACPPEHPGPALPRPKPPPHPAVLAHAPAKAHAAVGRAAAPAAGDAHKPSAGRRGGPAGGGRRRHSLDAGFAAGRRRWRGERRSCMGRQAAALGEQRRASLLHICLLAQLRSPTANQHAAQHTSPTALPVPSRTASTCAGTCARLSDTLAQAGKGGGISLGAGSCLVELMEVGGKGCGAARSCGGERVAHHQQEACPTVVLPSQQPGRQAGRRRIPPHHSSRDGLAGGGRGAAAAGAGVGGGCGEGGTAGCWLPEHQAESRQRDGSSERPCKGCRSGQQQQQA